MHNRSKLVLAGLAAAMLLSLGVSSASARNLSLSEQGSRIVWTPLEFIAGGRTVRCNVTLDSRFHYRTIVKREGALVGFVNNATVNTCVGGSATVLSSTLPWHITYNGFSGTLPNITAIRLNQIGTSFNIRPDGTIACLARSTAENPAKGIAEIGAGGAITGLRADETVTIPLEGFFCSFAGEGAFRGRGVVTAAVGGGSVFVRLI